MITRICTRLARRLIVVLMAFSLLLPVSFCLAVERDNDAVRATIELNENWRFQFGDVPASVTEVGYDDSEWQLVTVPHTWNRVGNYDVEVAPDTNKEQGVGWYRLRFNMPVRKDGRRHFLQFDAVATIAEVWVNGIRLGEHRGAFSRFRFDVTDVLKPGSNVVAVKADNSAAAPGSSTEYVLPLGGDYFLFGGIYRNVSLISTASAQIDMLDHGGPGVYIQTPEVGADYATVEVMSRLRNFGGQVRQLALTTTILDAEGNAVVTDSTPVALAAASTAELRRTLGLEDPRLWNGRADPYLYRVAVELRDGKRVVDRVTEPLGVRTFSFDAEKGFILNGKPLQLRGASRHQDREGKGWALSPEDHVEDMAIMAEMGVNSVRQAHYQHAQAWTDAADRTGMIVWAELPYTHETSVTHTPLPAPAMVENAKSQLVELIRQNYNHPSIAIWALGNEVDVGTLVQVRRNRGKGELSRPRALLETLSELALQEDSSGRVTAYADCCEATHMALPGLQSLVGATTVTAFNRYFGWYYGEPQDMGEVLDGFHARYPDQPLGVSEYGAGGAFSQHTDNPQGGPPDAQGRPHPEEYQSWYHENNWQELRDRPWLFGTWIWNMFDFAAGSHSVARAEGETTNINDKGLVHRNRKDRKDAFYFYKANWSDEPVLHITSRRYVERAYPVVNVRVYSNAQQATLILNGERQGIAPCSDGICVWPDVRLAKGANTVQAEAIIDGEKQTDSVNWNAPDPQAGLRIMAGTLTGGVTSNGKRYGSDNFFVGGKGVPVVPFLIPNRKLKPVASTATPELYHAYREGSFSYELPLPNGKWTVTLHMFEPDAEVAAQRTFDVSVNGKEALKNFNPSKAAGGILTAVTRQFSAEVTTGKLALQFTARGGEALIAAITIER